MHRRNVLRLPERVGATLLAKPESSDRRAVPLDILARKVRQQTAPLSHEFEKSSPRVEVVLVLAEVIGEPVDSLGEESNLNFGRTCIIRVRAKLGDDRLFLLALQRHTCGSLSGKTPLETQKNRAQESTRPKEYSTGGNDLSSIRGHREEARILAHFS